MEHSMEAWKKPFLVDLAVLASEVFTDYDQHVATFLKTKNQSPEFWSSINNELGAQDLETEEINLRLHNIFLATLIQQRRTQIHDLYSLVDYRPSLEVLDLLEQMDQHDRENQAVI